MSGPLRRSAGVRLALTYAGLFALSALVMMAFVWVGTAALLNRQVEAAIRTDAIGLFERWSDGGVTALRETIDDRIAARIDLDAIYMLTDAKMRVLAGNLDAWPAGVTDPGTSYQMITRRGTQRTLAQFRRLDLPDGSHLLIGRDVQTRAGLRDLLADTLLTALALAAILGIAGAYAVQRLFRRMIANVSATSAALSAGDLSQRVRLSGRGDEFDRLAETINDMLDRIGTLMDGVRQVSDAIAHDLRTPIARARARLEDASTEAATTEEMRAAVVRAVADLDGVTAVFQALLRIAEIEAGARRAAFVPLDAAPLLADLAELYGAAAEERGLVLRLDAIGPLPLLGDRALIQQAVANLLDNALKFSPPGGTVALTARQGPNGVRVAVLDEGPGIPLSDRTRATERFYRGEAARHTPGAGLGLALVDAVAHLHGGTLTLLDAAPGAPAPGLAATILLPSNPPDPPAK